MLLIITYGSDDTAASAGLAKVERSLTSLREASVRLNPLTQPDVVAVIQRAFGIDREAADTHATVLHTHAAGNPFFLEEALKALIAEGRIRKVDDRSAAWDLTELALPSTVRDAVQVRLSGMSDAARKVAEIAAHPIVRSAVLDSLTSVRQRALHAAIAEAMIRAHGDKAVQHAAEIAVHLAGGSSLGTAERDLRFLAAAGRDALAKRADREAAQWLSEALQIAKQLPESTLAAEEQRALMEDPATARGRLGEPTEELWSQAYALAPAAGDDVTRSRVLRHMGLAAVWVGRTTDALRLFGEAEVAARDASRLDLAIRVRVTKGMILVSLGQSEEGKAALLEILPTGEQLRDDALLGRLHRALLQLYVSALGDGDPRGIHGQFGRCRVPPVRGRAARRTVAFARFAGRTRRDRN